MREIPRRKLHACDCHCRMRALRGSAARRRGAARRPHQPSAEVLVIHGTTCAQPSVDPQIGEIPPLKHNCWKAPRQEDLAAHAGHAEHDAAGRTAAPSRSPTTARPAEKPPRFKVSASISKPDGAGFNPLADITAEPGKKFHVGGFAYQNGSLVLAIRIVP